MFESLVTTRRLAMVGTLALLAGCTVITKGKPDVTPTPVATDTGPDADRLPTDAERHRVALLLPLSGTNSATGQAIANATTMALLDRSEERRVGKECRL